MRQQEPHYELEKIIETILFKAMEETIGLEALHDALRQVNEQQAAIVMSTNYQGVGIQFAHLSRIIAALETLYGFRSGQGLALRSGRACFKHGLREFGSQLGITDADFRLLPLNSKIYTAAQQVAEAFNKDKHNQVIVEEESSRFYIHINDCPICKARQSDAAICHMAVGLLHEALYWISGGKQFHVEETDCIAKGDAVCTLVIQKQTLE